MWRVLVLRVCGVLAALLLIGWRATLRIQLVGDPRPDLRAAKRRYVYAILHAQQLNFILLSDDVPILAMVSASKDGEWLVPLCRARGIVPVRGSTRKRGGDDKGGRAALALLAGGVRDGRPALLAVDGPKGPRSRAHTGVADLALETDACIVVAGVFPTHRRILHRTWDRTQLPRPFSTLVGRFRPPIDSRAFSDRLALRAVVTAELRALEHEFDPAEAAYASAELPDEEPMQHRAPA